MSPTQKLLRFAPVPRRTDRIDGWTSDRQHAFVWALARMPSVAAAARSVGMSAQSARRLRKAPGADGFARAWDMAWQMGMDAIRDTAIERGLNGQEYPIHRGGRVVGKVHRYDNRLLMRVLANCDRDEERLKRLRGPLPSFADVLDAVEQECFKAA